MNIPGNRRVMLADLASIDADVGSRVWAEGTGQYEAVPRDQKASNAIDGPADALTPISWQPEGVIALTPAGSVAVSGVQQSPEQTVYDGEFRPRISRPNPGVLITAQQQDIRLSGLDLNAGGLGGESIATNPALASHQAMIDAGYFVRMTPVVGYADPFGGRAAVRCLETATTGLHGISCALFSGTMTMLATLEFYLRPINREFLSIYGIWNGATYDLNAWGSMNPAGPVLGILGSPLGLTREPWRAELMQNGWVRFSLPYKWTRPNSQFYFAETLTQEGSTSFAGDVARGFDFFGPIVSRPRQIVSVDTWSQTTVDSQPTLAQARHSPIALTVITHEGAGAQYMESTDASERGIIDGTPITITFLGERTHVDTLASDVVIWRAQDAAGTTYIEVGLTDSAGIVYHYVRQVVSGGATTTVLSPTRAAHVPTARSVVLNGTTAQWYCDDHIDGTSSALVLSAFACARIRHGAVSGQCNWQTALVAVRGRVLSTGDVTGLHDDELTAHYGFGAEPWHLISVGPCQSNGMASNPASKYRNIVGPKTRVWTPSNVASGALFATQSYGLRPLISRDATDELLASGGVAEEEAWGLAAGLARELGARKAVICQCAQGGSGWPVWQPGAVDGFYELWIARLEETRDLIATGCVYSHVVSMLGEGDGGPGNTAENERSLVATTINAARIALGNANMRHILCTLSESTQTSIAPYAAVVNAGFALRAAEDALTTLVSTEGRAVGVDQIHFLARARNEIGFLAARSVIATW